MSMLKQGLRICSALILGIAACIASDALVQKGPAVPFLIDISDRPIPKFENGFVISFEPNLANVWLFDAQGNRVKEVVLRLPASYGSLIRIGDAAASKEGRVAIAATASDSKSPKLIAWFDASGQLDKVIRTAPFAAHQVAFATDGTLWAVGNVYNEQRTSDVPAHDVVWQFDADGKVLRTLLPNTSFKTHGYPASNAFLRTANGKMTVYFDKTKEWVEIANSGELLGRWTVPVPAGVSITGVALTQSGDVVMTASIPEGNHQKPLAYRFEKQSGQLIPLDTSAFGADFPMLLGADGNRLTLFGMRPFKIISAALAMQ